LLLLVHISTIIFTQFLHPNCRSQLSTIVLKGMLQEASAGSCCWDIKIWWTCWYCIVQSASVSYILTGLHDLRHIVIDSSVNEVDGGN
jgi:hypothetical protein